MYGMLCETQNLLTSQYTGYSEFLFNRNLYHIETSQFIYNPMQINWMVLIDSWSLTRNGLDFFEVQQVEWSIVLFSVKPLT